MIRKGQVRWLAKADVIGQVLFVKPNLRVENCLIIERQNWLSLSPHPVFAISNCKLSPGR